MAEAEPEVRVIGVRRTVFRDLYHRFLLLPWHFAVLDLVVAYLGLNGIFALLYRAVGGVSGARTGSLFDAFCFSIQTMGTIGYGVMAPQGVAAHLLVATESMVGLLVTALCTGLVFAKFSRSTARVVFARQATITPMDGVPTLMMRVGNERGNLILEAQVRVVLLRTERTLEGVTFYRMYDLPLLRERSPALSRSWSVMHRVDEKSPLYGKTPALLQAEETELLVTITGVDDTSVQPVHARHRYVDCEIIWGARHADVVSEAPDGVLVLDVRKFHDLLTTLPTSGFPYPATAGPPSDTDAPPAS